MAKSIQSRIWFFSLVDSQNNIENIMEEMRHSGAKEIFAILHDKDVNRQEDGSILPKANHHHFAIRYSNPTCISVIANMCGLTVDNYNLIQKAKNYRKACRYLLHLDDPQKCPYPIEEIIVLKGTKDDYYKIISGQVKVATSDYDLLPDFCEFDKRSYNEQYLDIFKLNVPAVQRNKLINALDKSYDNYIKKRRIEMNTKKVTVLFVEGDPGSGKSTYAKNLALSEHKSFCISSSSNDVLQDYTCEDILILDDLRDNAFTFSDILKLLDNYVISSVKSRYHNKTFIGDTIVITSCKPLKDWYPDIEEDKRQLYRRINGYVYCRRDGNILFADMFIAPKGKTAIDDNGCPNGFPFSVPIITFTEEAVDASEAMWASLGFDVSQIIDDAKKSIEGRAPTSEPSSVPKGGDTDVDND